MTPRVHFQILRSGVGEIISLAVLASWRLRVFLGSGLTRPPFKIPPPPPFAKGGDGGICSNAAVDVRRYVNSVEPSPPREERRRIPLTVS